MKKKKKIKATSNDTIVVSQALNETSVAIYSGCKWRTCESKLKYFAIICCPFPFPFRKKKKNLTSPSRRSHIITAIYLVERRKLMEIVTYIVSISKRS